MNASQIHLLVTIVVFVAVAILIFVFSRNKNALMIHPLTGLAFAFILSGLLFGDNGLIGYGLMGIGVIFAVIDMIRRSRAS